MWVDYHNHTRFCHHAIGSPNEYVAQAQRLGLAEFGFSEHSPWMMDIPEHPLGPSRIDWDLYSKEVASLQSQLRARKSPLKLRFGVEIDYTPGSENIARHFLESQPFDYAIGSVHSVVLSDEDSEEDYANGVCDLRRHYELYFAQLKMMCLSGLIDIIGHLDLPKRDGHVPVEGYYDLVQDSILALKESSVVVEVNTSGYDKPIREFFPSPKIIRLLVKEGVPMTLGSDAHSPADVGRYLPEAVALLRDCGAKEVISFEGRRRMGKRI